MSEKFTQSAHEKNVRQEADRPQHETETNNTERLHEAAERNQAEQLEEKRALIEKHAKSANEYDIKKQETTAEKNHPVYINKHLKESAYNRSMIRTRKKLPAPSRALSKVIHAPVIEQASETVAKTVARPSSMLGGAFVALIGTSLLLWITRRYGYEYNYLAVLLLFGIGFVVGITIEFLWRLVARKRQF